MKIHGFYINLDSRQDRRNEFEKELEKMGIDGIERFPAIHHPCGQLGCTASHIQVLKLARERNYDYCFIFEDDFEFLVDRKTLDTVISKIPDSFDVIMLSYNLIHGIEFNDTFGRALDVQTASGYIVHSKFYTTLIDRIEEGLFYMSKNPVRNVAYAYVIDAYWKQLQTRSTWLYSLIRIGKQRPGFSNLEGKYVDHKV